MSFVSQFVWQSGHKPKDITPEYLQHMLVRIQKFENGQDPDAPEEEEPVLSGFLGFEPGAFQYNAFQMISPP